MSGGQAEFPGCDSAAVMSLTQRMTAKWQSLETQTMSMSPRISTASSSSLSSSDAAIKEPDAVKKETKRCFNIHDHLFPTPGL
jgi:hypothetical protein